MSYYNGKRDQSKTRKSRLILGWAKKLRAIELCGGSCSCGEKRPWLMEFHHREDELKENEISYLKHLSWDRLVYELQKCDLVCRNCHGDIHFKEQFLLLEEDIRAKIVVDKKESVNHSKILELNRQGMTQAQISKEVSCGLSTVCETLKSNGIHTELKKRKIDPLEIIDLRSKGFSNPEIAEKLSIHRFTIPQVIKKWREQNDS